MLGKRLGSEGRHPHSFETPKSEQPESLPQWHWAEQGIIRWRLCSRPSSSSALFARCQEGAAGGPDPGRRLERPRVAPATRFGNESRFSLPQGWRTRRAACRSCAPLQRQTLCKVFVLCYYFLTGKPPKASFNFSCEVWFLEPMDSLLVHAPSSVWGTASGPRPVTGAHSYSKWQGQSDCSACFPDTFRLQPVGICQTPARAAH